AVVVILPLAQEGPSIHDDRDGRFGQSPKYAICQGIGTLPKKKRPAARPSLLLSSVLPYAILD
ncbi:hypothetical protein, partial [Mesorhizobium sp.]|uniref:hypothetical protein n=1 Tax=Mesorhizobium sp. TaxID=1871066 RepID=UPI0025C429BA